MAVILSFWQFLLKFCLIKYRDGIFISFLYTQTHSSIYFLVAMMNFSSHFCFYFSFCHIFMNNLSFMTSALSMFCFNIASHILMEIYINNILSAILDFSGHLY